VIATNEISSNFIDATISQELISNSIDNKKVFSKITQTKSYLLIFYKLQIYVKLIKYAEN